MNHYSWGNYRVSSLGALSQNILFYFLLAYIDSIREFRCDSALGTGSFLP
jgi:hypothetical protein